MTAGWLTGKLSDFAGMIVAPVLAAAITRARGEGARAFAFALVVLPFVAINLAPSAADTMVLALAAVGLRWQIWTDWTDLVALGVLPAAWLVSTGRWRLVRVPRVPLREVGVFVGAAACLATSVSYEALETSVYLANLTDRSVTVDIYRPVEALDCDLVDGSPETSLVPDRFQHDKCRSVGSREVVPMDHDWATIES